MPELLILYNASGSLLGHANYAYHHLRQTPGQDCSACTLTHGPKLSLGESTEWASTKRRIEQRGVVVRQLHTEDLDASVRLSSWSSLRSRSRRT